MTTPSVRAILVTDGRSRHLDAVLAAIWDQETAPASLVVVIVDPGVVELEASEGVHVTRVGPRSYAAAVAEAVGASPARRGELLWLLHDDAAPAPDALTRLVATAQKRPNAAVVGAAQVRWKDTSRLVSLGTTVSRWGVRRVGLVVEDDINQGQHDWREDVLAVSLAGAVVRREAFDALGGIDAGYRGFGDSLEWCRRAWAAGWDVVIQPAAVVRHAQDSLYGARSGGGGRASTHALRRVSEWHHAFAWAPWWKAALLALLVVPSAAVRIVLRVAQHATPLAVAEASVPFRLIARVPAIAATAASHRAVGARRRIEPRLFATTRQVIDAIRHKEFGRIERERAARIPTDIVRAELQRAAGKQRLSVAVTLGVSVAVAAALGVGWLRAIAAGLMVTGEGIGSTDVSLSHVWERTWSGWSEAGFGSPGIDGAFAGLVLPLAAAPGGTRVWFALVLATAPVAAAIAAWAAAGAATRGPWMRAAGALVFAGWPPFIASILDARLGAVVAHVALGVAAAALARAGGWRRGELVGGGEELDSPAPSTSAGVVASLALTAATVAQPVLLLPAVVIVALLGAIAGGRRWRLWSVAVVPLMVGMPGLVAAARQWSDPSIAAGVLAREPGPGAGFEGSSAGAALGFADVGRWHPLFEGAAPVGALAALVLVACALAALANARAWRAAAMGVAVAGLGAGAAALSTSVVVAWPDGAGSVAQHGWPGPGSSLVAVGALVAALSAHGSLLVGVERKHLIGRTAASGAATLALGGLLASVVFVAWPGAQRGDAMEVDSDVLPLAIPLDQEGRFRQRALILSQREDGVVAFSVLATDGSTWLAGRADVGPDGRALGTGGMVVGTEAIAEAVASLSASGAAPVATLVEWGIGTIVVAPGADRVRGALDQNDEVSLVGGSERGTAYRVAEGIAARAWIVSEEDRVALTSTSIAGTTSAPPDSGGTLVIAVPASSGWTAEADGVALSRVDDALGRAAFAVPGGADTVSYAYRDPAQRWWWWASALALLWAALGSLPLRPSRELG